MPKDNESDVQNLPKDIIEGIQFHYIKTFDEAFKHLFPELEKAPVTAQAAQAWSRFLFLIDKIWRMN